MRQVQLQNSKIEMSLKENAIDFLNRAIELVSRVEKGVNYQEIRASGHGKPPERVSSEQD